MAAKDRQLETQIKELHNPSGREIDVKSLLQLVKRITSMISNDAQEEGDVNGIVEKIQPLSLTWRQLYLPVLEDTSKGFDNHTVTLKVLQELKQFGWDAKAVTVLASFALNHCLWMVAQIYSSSPPALQTEKHNDLHAFLSSWLNKVSDVDPYYFYLSQICSISKKPEANQLPKPALTKLLQALVQVVKCVIDLEELPSADLQGNETQYEKAMAGIPITVYQIINTVVHCAALIRKFPINDYEISRAEEDDLTSYADQLNTRTETFRNQIKVCNDFLDETKVDKTYQMPIGKVDGKDNRKALEFLMKGGSDQQFQNEVDKIIKQLKGKHVLLLVSYDEISTEELLIFDHFYGEITSRPLPAKPGREADELSFLWIPLYSSLGKESIEHLFQTQKKDMSWFTVPHPSVVSKQAAEFIKSTWKLQSKSSILVALDPQGTVLNINAFHMISIWSVIPAFPFTRSKERALWKSTTLTMEFILGWTDQRVFQWMQKEDNYLTVYGGNDLEWIRKFAIVADRLSKRFNIRLKGLYIGKPNHQKANSKIKEMIEKENISFVLFDDMLDWFFWSRVRSMVISKMSHQRGSETEDQMTRKLKLLLGYETERSWALIGKRKKVVTHGPGRLISEAMMELDKSPLAKSTTPINFEKRLEEAVAKVETRGKSPCCEIEFPVRCTGMPETLKCPNPNCNSEEMDTRIVFECCHPTPALKR